MAKYKPLFTRGTALALTVAMAAASVVPILLVGKASAGLPTSRKITLSSSAASAADVTYSVSFVTGTAAAVQDLVLQFCSNSPIIGDSTCTAPAGMDLNSGNEVLGTQVGITDWAVDGAHTTASKLTLNRSSAQNPGSGTTVSFTYTNVTNPNTANTTFYARLLTFGSDAAAAAYTEGTPGAYVDAGGVALSTAAQIIVTAKVQERLTFCVYTNANCGLGGSSVKLGDINGVLDPAHAYTDISTKFDVGTNAISGVAVVMKGTTLTSGVNTITPIPSLAASTVSNEQFGMCLWQSNGSGLTPDAAYFHANCHNVTSGIDATASSQFAFDETAATSAAGSPVGAKIAGDTSTATLAFLGNIAWATQAGIYTTTLTFIATGTY